MPAKTYVERKARELTVELGIGWNDTPTIAALIRSVIEDCAQEAFSFDIDWGVGIAENLGKVGLSIRGLGDGLANEMALKAVYECAGDFETPGNEREAKTALATLLRRWHDHATHSSGVPSGLLLETAALLARRGR